MPQTLESWFPRWAHELAAAHAGGTSQTFVLHGNVDDLIRTERRGEIAYTMLPEFLAGQLFGGWDVVLVYDQVHGPRALAATPARLEKINQLIERFIGPVETLRATRAPAQALVVLHRFLELALLREGERPSVALILEYAQLLAPAAAGPYTSRELAANLATLLSWAKSPYFKRAPFAFCLISERLSDLHGSLVQSAHTVKLELTHPGRTERLAFLRHALDGRDADRIAEVGPEVLAELSAGLTLVQLQGLVHGAERSGRRLTLAELKSFKKRMIEGQCQGLVEFVEPEHGLELVQGHEAAKRRLDEDARLCRQGRLDAVPMGYLICGPVGTGKTFLAECYAGSVGIACLKLRNFRSKYVGETEGNLEKILRVLRAMGPVAVIIDEADAMLGDREQSGDSGTSGRVFGQFAAQMGDTAYRGRIIWFLLTCRPDLLPIDLKRQGRCEVHIPLFYPASREEVAGMFVVLGKKNRIDVDAAEVPELPEGLQLSGADIEGVVTRARRAALLAGSPEVDAERLRAALADFVPAADGDEKELQVLAAVLECTDRDFLPASWQRELAAPGGRAVLLRRFRELRGTLSGGDR